MRFLYSSILTVYFLLFPLSAFSSPKYLLSPEEIEQFTSSVWTYDDDYTGQEDWGYIKGFEVCEKGSRQSPINITFTKKTKLPKLVFSYDKTEGYIELTHRSFGVQIINGGKVSYDGKSYNLRSIEFHSPNSHKIKDSFNPAEVHLIHEDEKGDILAIAILIVEGEENPAIGAILKQAAPHNRDGMVSFEILDLLPYSPAYYTYDGSLPYPPCTENVKWIVMKNPISFSEKQFSELVSYTGRNSRLTQPIYMRQVLESQ